MREAQRLALPLDALPQDEELAAALTLSIAEVARISPAGADLLNAAAVLAPEPIPEELFSSGGPSALDEMLAPLLRYALLERDHDRRSVRVPLRVREILKRNLGEAGNASRERMVAALDRVFPEPEFANWPRCESLLPHLFAVAPEAEDSLSLASLLDHGGWYLTERARLAEAEPLLQRALAIREAALDEEHSDVAKSLNNLARLYQEQGHLKKAEPLFERSLGICERTLAASHPDLVSSLNNLASVYRDQGRYGEAELLYRRSLAIFETEQGADNPDLAMSLDNLASLYQAQARHGEAELLYQRALAIREKTLGADHPDVAKTLDNLVGVYQRRGMHRKAEPLGRRALSILEKAFGADHPEVAKALDNLADLYVKLGRGRDAKSLFQRARDARKRYELRNRPPRHPSQD